MDIAKVSAALLRMDAARIARGVKRRWMDKMFPYGAYYHDEVARFDRLYLVRDPWSLSSESERSRFRQANRAIMENFGHLQGVLEIGCGGGLQSCELQQVCDRPYGVDVSGRAVRRARRRCPQATFAVGVSPAASHAGNTVRPRDRVRGSILHGRCSPHAQAASRP